MKQWFADPQLDNLFGVEGGALVCFRLSSVVYVTIKHFLASSRISVWHDHCNILYNFDLGNPEKGTI